MKHSTSCVGEKLQPSSSRALDSTYCCHLMQVAVSQYLIRALTEGIGAEPIIDKIWCGRSICAHDAAFIISLATVYRFDFNQRSCWFFPRARVALWVLISRNAKIVMLAF